MIKMKIQSEQLEAEGCSGQSWGIGCFSGPHLLAGWIGILVSLLITVPLLRRLGWTSGLSTAVVITVMFLGIPNYTLLLELRPQ